MALSSSRVAILLFLVACAPRPATSPRQEARRVAETVDIQIVRSLIILATARIPSEEELVRDHRRLEDGEVTWADYIARLVKEPGLGKKVAPNALIARGPVNRQPVLEKDPKTSVYFLRKGCPVSKAVPVQPWWDMAKTVQVCPDAYQPLSLKDPKTGWLCGSLNVTDSIATMTHCGCGRNLINCEAPEGSPSLTRSFLREVIDTISVNVNQDLPLARVFTDNATFRDTHAEREYRRWRLADGQPVPELVPVDWPPEGKLAPREESYPGEHAGLLTSPGLVMSEDSPRSRLRGYTTLLWCSTMMSTEVETARILSLGAVNLRNGEGWQKLAAMDGCTSCHARLDYSMQFFGGFGNPYDSNAVLASKRNAGSGPLYVHDNKDLRGRADLTPQAWARMAVAQPEFARCQSAKVADYVLGLEATQEDLTRLEAAFKKRPTFQGLMEAALLLYVQHRTTRTAPQTPVMLRATASGPQSGTGAAPDGEIRLSGTQVEFIATHCLACHGDSDKVDLSRTALAPSTVRKIVYQVSFGGMPKESVLSFEERSGFVLELVRELYGSEPELEQKVAALFLPEHYSQQTVSLYWLSELLSSAVKSDVQQAQFEAGDLHYTQYFALAVVAEAYDACVRRKLSGDALASCVDDATDPFLVTK
jgi:hypothetical protein